MIVFALCRMFMLQPISVIAPFVQQKRAPAYSTTQSTKSLHDRQKPIQIDPLRAAFNSKLVKRHQSFHGFQSHNDANYQGFIPPRYQVQNSSNWYLPNVPSNPPFIPSIFYHLPPSFYYTPGSNTISTITTENPVLHPYTRAQSITNVNENVFHQPAPVGFSYNPFIVRNPFSPVVAPPRVAGRKELEMNIRRSSSGINIASNNSTTQTKIPKPTVEVINEKRFGSLELKKHKCYSPTFYSMRCKKHSKKRPVVYALPRKPKNHVSPAVQQDESQTEKKPSDHFQNLTESIQILEQDKSATDVEVPKPAPRCKRSKKNDIIYQNISKNVNINQGNTNNDQNADNDMNTSNNSSENAEPEITVTEAVVHKTNNFKENEEDASKQTSPKIPTSSSDLNLSSGSSKLPTKPNTPKPSPKPKSEPVKGALAAQIHSKLKHSLPSLPSGNASKIENNSDEAEHASGTFSYVPQMPILDAESKWSSNNAISNQVCFFFVCAILLPALL